MVAQVFTRTSEGRFKMTDEFRAALSNRFADPGFGDRVVERSRQLRRAGADTRSSTGMPEMVEPGRTDRVWIPDSASGPAALDVECRTFLLLELCIRKVTSAFWER